MSYLRASSRRQTFEIFKCAAASSRWQTFKIGKPVVDYPTLCTVHTNAKMSEMFTPAAEPKTELGRYRVLGPNAGIRVSPLQLGGMSIGDAWYVFSIFSILLS
jgi:hypothetical protein